VFKRTSVFRKKKAGKLVDADIDTSRFPKLHNVSHCASDSLELGIPLFNDTTNGEKGMALVKRAYRQTQRRHDDSTDYQMLFYLSFGKFISDRTDAGIS
jgi:hypothetical protein